MKVRAATIEEIGKYDEYSSKYNIKEGIIAGLIRTGNAIVVDDIGYAAGAMSIGADGEIVYRCILVGADNNDKALDVLRTLKSMFCNVALSEDVMNYCGLKMKGSGIWHDYHVVAEELPSYVKAKKKVLSDLYYSNEHIEIIKLVEQLSYKECKDSYYSDDDVKVIDKIESKMTKYCDGVWSMPVLSKEFCERLLMFESKQEYKVNDREEYAVQIPEIVIEDVDKELHSELVNIFTTSVVPLAKALYMSELTTLTSVQFARYDVSDVFEGNWHFDRDSDVTLVINLSGDDVECGGTIIKPFGANKEVVVPKLPVGHGLLFKGSILQHKGLPVTKGTRKILVFWSV